MKIAVYNAHWPTAGGGEKFAAAIAQALRDHHDVTLLGHDPIDLAWLSERLALDLEGLPVRQIGAAGRLEEASSSYDLLINASFHSSDRNGAPRGIYVVNFPQDPWASLSPKQRELVRFAGPVLGARRPLYEPGAGFYPPDPLRASRVWWTDGDGELDVWAPAGREVTLRLLFANLLPAGTERTATIESGGTELASVTVGGPSSLRSRLAPQVAKVPVIAPADGAPVRLKVRSEAHTPAEEGGEERRLLGVPLMGVAVGRRPISWVRAAASVFRAYPPSARFVDTYDLILANSVFTQRWTRSYWGCPSEALNPPVTLREPAPAKQPIILSVGRFFPPERGHSKKQLEMVDAFGELLRSGTAQGWELHLVGGCSPIDRPYLDAVRRAAEGLPVTFHVDASGDEVDSLYGAASIYWHAAGYGEDLARHPERMEHFGITTVEAMSAGAVPVAYGEAGPLEAFDDSVEGFHFHTLDRLVAATSLLISQPERRAEMAQAAIERAQRYSTDHFTAQVNRYVDQVASEADG